MVTSSSRERCFLLEKNIAFDRMVYQVVIDLPRSFSTVFVHQPGKCESVCQAGVQI